MGKKIQAVLQPYSGNLWPLLRALPGLAKSCLSHTFPRGGVDVADAADALRWLLLSLATEHKLCDDYQLPLVKRQRGGVGELRARELEGK